MKGYYNRPEATAEAIDAEGWFHTGDIGELDAEGYLTITDRKKDLIVTSGGKNVAPQPIENLLKMSPFMAQAVLIGDQPPLRVALVVPNFGRLKGTRAREQRMGGRAAPTSSGTPGCAATWRPRSGSIHGPGLVRDAQEDRSHSGESSRSGDGFLTPSLKVKRRVVHEPGYKDLIDSLYEAA